MNEQEQAELEALKRQQTRLLQEVHALSSKLASLEQHLTASSASPPSPAAAMAQPQPEPAGRAWAAKMVAPTQAPPVMLDLATAQPGVPAAAAIPAPSPLPQPGSQAQAAIAGEPSAPLRLRVELAKKKSAPPPLPPVAPPEPNTEPEPLSLEMKLGTYWLVRIGIVLVLGSLAFFAKIAYQNYISRLGPGGKVGLLYGASALLLGAGWWWQRQAAKETLKNYAQVLFAGGLAALYFTTYAAHYIEPLMVIQSRLLDGVLLLACAGFMVWCADRKQSEVLAMFAVLLAYFTSIITRIGYFTLYSNLLLTAAGVAFLVRNRWAVLSFGSVVATYAAYGFWRFFDGSMWHWASPAEGLWAGTFFLFAYWALFTAAVFLSRGEHFAGENRAAFLTLNNGALFTMFLLTMMQVHQGGFWKFALVYGATLLACAAGARALLSREPLAKNAYLTQGLLLVTVGFISKYAGLQLALVLAMESVVLLITGRQRRNVVLLTGAYIAAGLAAGWGIDGMRQMEPAGAWLAVGLGGLLLVNGIVSGKAHAPSATLVRPGPTYFSVLCLVVWLVATFDNTQRAQFPVWLAVEALLLTLSVYALRLPEVTIFGQAYLLIAQVAYIVQMLDEGAAPPWWSPAVVLAATLVLSHWWQRQRTISVPPELPRTCQGAYALALVAVLYFWLAPKYSPPAWLGLTALLAVGFTLYGVMTRAWFIAAFGQIFLAVSGAQFFTQSLHSKPGWAVSLAPLAALALLSGGTVEWFRRKEGGNAAVREPLLQTALMYRWVALAMSLLWVWEYIPERERIWLLSLLGLWAFVWSGLKRNQEALLFSAVFTGAALVLFWLPLLQTSTVYWPNLCAVVLLLCQRQIARRLPERYGLEPRVHATVILVGGVSLWLFVSRWVGENDNTRYLTACWSVLALALFGTGIILRERTYRWLGLGILGCALVRVAVVDVWKLVALYRVLSLLALGLVLLVLGFIYSKYQEKIRQWL